jgi:hypothetical protein
LTLTPNTILRIALLAWVLGYLLISCGSLIGGDVGGGLIGLVAGAVLFLPWLLGLMVLSVLVLITNPRRR